jgi:hypothetical protein
MPPTIGGIDHKHKNDNRAESPTLNHADGRRARLAQRRVTLTLDNGVAHP